MSEELLLIDPSSVRLKSFFRRIVHHFLFTHRVVLSSVTNLCDICDEKADRSNANNLLDILGLLC
jgi:hypothetical protein